jgi:protein-disulfide isomerase
MKPRNILACTLAIAALAGCNQNNNQGQAPTADTGKVTITQASPPPGGTWVDVVNETSAGYVMGNPNAKVKLVEIGSLGCPVCKKFEDEGAPQLREMVKGGQLSWEFRPYLIHGAIDMAANLIARCNGPKTFFPIADALYKDQDKWMGKLQTVPEAQLQQVQNLPPNQVFVEIAKLVGLQDWAAARGIPQAKSNQCLSNQAMIDKEVQVSTDVNNQYPDFKGTPSFILNGTLLEETSSWEKLKPQLEAALK